MAWGAYFILGPLGLAKGKSKLGYPDLSKPVTAHLMTAGTVHLADTTSSMNAGKKCLLPKRVQSLCGTYIDPKVGMQEPLQGPSTYHIPTWTLRAYPTYLVSL